MSDSGIVKFPSDPVWARLELCIRQRSDALDPLMVRWVLDDLRPRYRQIFPKQPLTVEFEYSTDAERLVGEQAVANAQEAVENFYVRTLLAVFDIEIELYQTKFDVAPSPKPAKQSPDGPAKIVKFERRRGEDDAAGSAASSLSQ